MCDSSLRLVAWIDGELSESEAAVVEHHVQGCADCQQRVSAYEAASLGFSAHYTAALDVPKAAPVVSMRRIPRWTPIAAAAAAAIVIGLLLLPRPQQHIAPAPQVAKAGVPIASETPVEPAQEVSQVPAVTKRRPATRRQPIHEDWAIAQPGIQIAIPADSMFPPGAVPEGVAYIANVSFAADGSVQGFRLHP